MSEANSCSFAVGVAGGVVSMLGKGPDWWFAEAENDARVEAGGVTIDDVRVVILELLLLPLEASLSTPSRLLG
jgi:hypothetical protein